MDVIQHGDTISSIARRFNVTLQQLVDLNHIATPNLIYAGSTLMIPPK